MDNIPKRKELRKQNRGYLFDVLVNFFSIFNNNTSGFFYIVFNTFLVNYENVYEKLQSYRET